MNQDKLNLVPLDSRIIPQQPIRNMKFLSVHKSEMNLIASLSALVTAFCSIGTFFVSTVVTTMIDVAITGPKNIEEGTLFILKISMSFLILLSFLSYLMAFFQWKKGNFIRKTIEQESGEC